MGLLQRGATFLARKFKENESRTITYHRADSSVALSATPGRTMLQLTTPEGGVEMIWTDRDYTFTKADLILHGAATEPQRGDWIEDSLDDGKFVLLPYFTEPMWKPCDEFDIAIRIHTKLEQTA